MTKLEERLKQLLRNFEPFNYGNSDDEQRDAFVEGFRAALEMPELKAVFEALEFYADKKNYKEGSGCSTFGISFGEIIEEPTYAIWDDEGQEASGAIAQWRTFIGEESETL